MEISEVEIQVGELETRVERLRSLYDQYFMGIEKLEPGVPRKDVDRRIHALRKEQIRNTGLRFRFQMILQRYNTYQTYWIRICRQIEDGTYKRHMMRAHARFGDAPPSARMKVAAPKAPTIPPPEAEAPMDLRDLEDDFGDLSDIRGKGSLDAEFGLLEDPLDRAPSSMPFPGALPAKSGNAAPPPPPSSAQMLAAPPVAPRSDPRILAAPDGVARRSGAAPPPSPSLAPGAQSPAKWRKAAPVQLSERAPPAPASAPVLPSARPAPPPTPPAVPSAKPAAPTSSGALRAAPRAPAAPPPLPPKAQKPAPPAPAAQSVQPPPRPAARDDLPEERVRQLYAQYVDTKRKQNESTAAVTYDGLAKSLRESSAKLREKHGKKVDFEIAVKDGKTIIRPVVK